MVSKLYSTAFNLEKFHWFTPTYIPYLFIERNTYTKYCHRTQIPPPPKKKNNKLDLSKTGRAGMSGDAIVFLLGPEAKQIPN